jgi:hypothetical protein
MTDREKQLFQKILREMRTNGATKQEKKLVFADEIEDVLIKHASRTWDERGKRVV